MIESFDNFIVGPAIAIPILEMKQETLKDILEQDLVVIAYITDTKHEVFEKFKDADIKPVAVFVTVQYKYFYE